MYELFELKYNNAVFTIEIHTHGKEIQREYNLPSEISLGLYINHGNSGDVIALSSFNIFELLKDIESGAFNSIVKRFIEEEHELLKNYGEECFCKDLWWTSIPNNMVIPNQYISEQLKIINKNM